MKVLLNLNVEVEAVDVQTYQKGIDWPVGVIPIPGVGDAVSLTAGLNRVPDANGADVITRTFYPEGLLVKDASLGVVHCVLLLSTDEHAGPVTREALERSGWRVAGV